MPSQEYFAGMLALFTKLVLVTVRLALGVNDDAMAIVAAAAVAFLSILMHWCFVYGCKNCTNFKVLVSVPKQRQLLLFEKLNLSRFNEE